MRLRKHSLFPCIYATNFPGQRRNCQTSHKINDGIQDGYARGIIFPSILMTVQKQYKQIIKKKKKRNNITHKKTEKNLLRAYLDAKS